MLNKRMVSLKLYISTVIVLILLGILGCMIIEQHYEKKMEELSNDVENIKIIPNDGNINFNNI